ncbi:MAG TPA: chromosome partitioning protein ParB [Crenotrichaceae bacterium]|nr:chromosome partitioning protein ParB [Crenotrichaceae bacterium]
MNIRNFLIALTFSLSLLTATTATAKSACKELSKNACGNSNSCSWTKGYTTKKGVKVSSYCRNKPGKKKAKKVKSSKSKSTKSKKKKTSSKKANK